MNCCGSLGCPKQEILNGTVKQAPGQCSLFVQIRLYHRGDVLNFKSILPASHTVFWRTGTFGSTCGAHYVHVILGLQGTLPGIQRPHLAGCGMRDVERPAC
jgi:hypothetical protein